MKCCPLICDSSPGFAAWEPCRGLLGDQRPWRSSHSLGTPPRIPCLHCWCSTQLPARPLPVFIGSGDCYWSGWQLSARLSAAAFPCSPAAPRRCPTSQHYCSCWAFCLKSFPAVSWYGKPLKLAPDCSVYFSLDKRQNTLPADCRQEGGTWEGGWGAGDPSRVSYRRSSSQTRLWKGTNAIVTGLATDTWLWRPGQAVTLDPRTPPSRKENPGLGMMSRKMEAEFPWVEVDISPLTTGLVPLPAVRALCSRPGLWQESPFSFKLSFCTAMPDSYGPNQLKFTGLPLCSALENVRFSAVI